MYYFLYRYEKQGFDNTYIQKVYMYDFLTVKERYDLKQKGWKVAEKI